MAKSIRTQPNSAVTLSLLDRLTALLGIQRQYHSPYLGEAHPVARLAAGGADCVGIFGHRDQTTERGRGDPGDAVMAAGAEASYLGLNFDTGADREFWRPIQRDLGIEADGIPGPQTVAALVAAGHRCGMWVPRPRDAET